MGKFEVECGPEMGWYSPVSPISSKKWAPKKWARDGPFSPWGYLRPESPTGPLRPPGNPGPVCCRPRQKFGPEMGDLASTPI